MLGRYAWNVQTCNTAFRRGLVNSCEQFEDPREHAQYSESVSNNDKGFLSPEQHT